MSARTWIWATSFMENRNQRKLKNNQHQSKANDIFQTFLIPAVQLKPVTYLFWVQLSSRCWNPPFLEWNGREITGPPILTPFWMKKAHRFTIYQNWKPDSPYTKTGPVHSFFPKSLLPKNVPINMIINPFYIKLAHYSRCFSQQSWVHTFTGYTSSIHDLPAFDESHLVLVYHPAYHSNQSFC